MKKLTNKECQIAQLQEICRRTLEILKEENFFDKTTKNGFWHSSLYRDLKRASEGKEFKLFTDLMKQLPCADKEK